ncbi:MAG: glycosyltransferase [Desulfobacterales bacterium]|nr:glycosyltransferase [Desulfobacterales bacterium]
MTKRGHIQVSVIIPAFNSAARLPVCLEALEKQTFPRDRYEIIVVDDGSRDDTALAAGRFNVRCRRQENKGPAAARNNGVSMARGDIVLFTDDDCAPDKNWITEMASALESEEVVGVKGAYKTAQGALWARFAQAEFNDRYRLLRKKKYIDVVDTHAAGYKKEVFLAMGGFDESFPVPNNEDVDLSYRMSVRGYKMVFNPNAVVWHADHPDTLAGYMKLKFWRGYWRMVVYRRFTGKMVADSYTPQTLKLQILLALSSLAGAGAMIFSPGSTALFLFFCLAAFLFSSASFMAATIPRDPLVGLLSPFFLYLRALSLGSGALYRIFRTIR